jgi:hypothetical protein
MKENSSPKNHSANEKIKSAGKRLYHYGVVFSAAMVVLSLLNNLGAQLANKFGSSKEHALANSRADSKLVYEKPAFSIFSSVVSEAKALVFVNTVT